MKFTIFSTGILAFLSIGICLWALVEFRFEPKEPLKGFHSPIVALELASSPQVFASTVGNTQDPNRIIVQKPACRLCIYRRLLVVIRQYVHFVCRAQFPRCVPVRNSGWILHYRRSFI